MAVEERMAGSGTIVVIPCYNESRRLDCDAILAFAESHSGVELLLVDDGSTDDTARMLADLASRSSSVSWQRLEKNSGKAEAVRQGVRAALAREPRYIGYWDADLATPLETIEDFVALLELEPGLLGALGSRIQRLGASIDRSPLRHYAGRLFATIASVALRMPVYDTQCGAKLFRAGAVVDGAFAEPFLSPWVFDVEVLARMRLALAPAALAPLLHEVPLPRWRDVAGSKMTFAKGAAAFLDLLRIGLRYR